MKELLFMMLAVLTAMTSMAQQKDPMVVQTESGLVKGIDQEGSMAFLGIPYAKVERFMPPKPVDTWDTIRVRPLWAAGHAEHRRTQAERGRDVGAMLRTERMDDRPRTSILHPPPSTIKARDGLAARRRF